VSGERVVVLGKVIGNENRRKKKAKVRYAVANLERRKNPRFPIRLAVEYSRGNSPINQTGQTVDASEGGLQVLLPEPMEIGQKLNMKLFFSSGSKLNSVEVLAEVVWINTQLGEGEKLFRSGVRFINVSREGVTQLKDFLASLPESP
jgi:c-di-GMP-binding flagellar brake protein YcgR